MPNLLQTHHQHHRQRTKFGMYQPGVDGSSHSLPRYTTYTRLLVARGSARGWSEGVVDAPVYPSVLAWSCSIVINLLAAAAWRDGLCTTRWVAVYHWMSISWGLAFRFYCMSLTSCCIRSRPNLMLRLQWRQPPGRPCGIPGRYACYGSFWETW